MATDSEYEKMRYAINHPRISPDLTLQPPPELPGILYGQLLQHKRERQRWTQEQLANMMGVPVSEVQRWENTTSYPEKDFLRKLADLLGGDIYRPYYSYDEALGAEARKEGVQVLSQPTPAPPAKVQGAQQSVQIFFCYAHEDEVLLNKLKSHLRPLQRQGLIDVWHNRDINAGTEWEQEIKKHLNEADIILLLVSPDFMDSDYCYSIEMQRALERHQRGEARVIPIILRHIYWQGILGNLQALPKDALPITDPHWYNLDQALHNVAEGIRKAVERLRE